MITREKIDLSIERRVLSNLIMSTPLLSKIRTVGDPAMFESTMSRAVATWVWEFFDRTGDAPGNAIKDIYTRRKRELRESDAELVAVFLETCSEEWLPTNDKQAEDMAVEYFQERALAMLHERIGRALSNHETSAGFLAVAEFQRPNVRVKESVSIFSDARQIAQAFDDTEETVFQFPGELGHVLGPFTTDDFIAFIAPPKRGKTWWLMATAFVAALKGKRVLFVSLEMTKKQMVRRFWQMITGCSRYGESAPWPVLEETGEGRWSILDREVKTERVETSFEGIAAIQESVRRVSRHGRLELRAFPTGTLSVRGLRSEITTMGTYENFVPDVVVVDSADIMDHGNSRVEVRHQINMTWQALRGLGLELGCLVVTASHTGTETMDGEKDASAKNVSEDRRKVAHVTKLVAINQTEQEKARGIYRISCSTTRDGGVIFDEVVCTNCLAIGRPYLECARLSCVDMGEAPYSPEENQPRHAGRRRTRR